VVGGHEMEQFMAHHVTHDVVRCLDDVPVKSSLKNLATPAKMGQLLTP